MDGTRPGNGGNPVAGGDHVQVDLQKADAAASALEGLRDALAQNAQAILTAISNLRGEGADLPPPSALQKLQGRAPQDAAEMRTVARLAEELNQQMRSMQPPIIVSGMFELDASWDPKSLDAADAKYEAQALKLAEDNKDPKAARAAIQAIQQDVQDHLDSTDPADQAWLSAFYNQSAPQVANLASVLHNQDAGGIRNYNNRFAVLTQSDQQILSTFANGLAAADKNGLSPQAVQQITNAPNLWSSAMLVKFGPNGSKWATAEQNPGDPRKLDQPSLLAQLTNSVYEAQSHGKLQLPLGGYHYDPMVTGSDYTQLQDAAANYDPLTALLQRDAENRDASWQVLGGKDGNGIAKQLLNEGVVPGGGNATIFTYSNDAPNRDGRFPAQFTGIGPNGQIPEDGIALRNTIPASVVASFLNASTSAGRGAGNPDDPINPYKLSAQSAVNIIDNTAPPWSDNNGTPQPSYDPAVVDALSNTAQRYMLDLARSTTNTGPSAVVPFGDQQGQPWAIQIRGASSATGDHPFDNTPLSNFLQEICADPKKAGTLSAAAKTQMGNYYALGQNGQLPKDLVGSRPDQEMASLVGRIQVEMNNDDIHGQRQVDEQHAEYNSMIKFAEDSAKFLPVVGDAADKAKDPVLDAADLLGVPTTFSTDNASNAQQIDDHNLAVDETQVHVPMVQALINTGAIPQSQLQGKPWFQHGQVILTGNNASDFNEWYQSNNGKWNLQNLEDQYQHAIELQQRIAETSIPAAQGSG